ncbi:MAG: hypothetical protein ACRD3Q_21270, partial [Terriglobales bacterium]
MVEFACTRGPVLGRAAFPVDKPQRNNSKHEFVRPGFSPGPGGQECPPYTRYWRNYVRGDPRWW